MNNLHMSELRAFSPIPYTRFDVYQAMCLVLGKSYVNLGVNKGRTLESMLGFARLMMYEEALNPYKPSCRVIRQASIDYENGGFNFHGESG